MAPETALSGMPMLALVGHLSLVHTYRIATRITVFRKSGIKTVEAEGASISHHVSLPAELAVALEAAKMSHVPGSTFGFGAFISKDYLKIQ